MKKTLPLLPLLLTGCIAQYQAPESGRTAMLNFSHTDGGVAEYFYLPTAGSCAKPELIGHIGPGFPMKGVLNDKNNSLPAGEEIGIMINIIPPGYPYTGLLCKRQISFTLEEGAAYELKTNLSQCTAQFGELNEALALVQTNGC